MASIVADAAPADDTDCPPRRVDPVPVVDISLLSQSELYSLSLSADSSFDLNNSDDIVIPKINRAVFNESAGSRKQTYSRFRLASASTTKTTTLHRRTPHLRASHTHPTSNINDPEQAENSQIIRMLKQLCKSNPDFQDIDQFDEENNHNSNSVVPELLNSETLAIKRKRGRPRKHENVVFIRPPSGKRLRTYTVKKEIVYDYEKDRGIVNDKGVTVNMAILAGLEDPYRPEISRRAVGMSTEDELLVFLRGLNGQWGSRRRKRRIVDASEFGDFLPKGWKLSLCIKKKEGRVWLFVRRYLSPSGRQFESCKEISAYLISLIGQENLDEQNNQLNIINNSDDSALKQASGIAASLALQENTKIDDHADIPSSPSSSPLQSPSSPAVPTNCNEQITVDDMEIQVESNVKKDNIECSLKDEIAKTKSLIIPTTELNCDPVLITEDNVVVETDDARSGDKLKINYGKESNTDEIVRDLNVESNSQHGINDNFIEESCDINEVSRITDRSPEPAVSQSELLGDEVTLSIEEINNKPNENFDENDFHIGSADNKSICNVDHGVSFGSFLLSSFQTEEMGKDSDVEKDDISVCVDQKSNCNVDQGKNSGVEKDDISVGPTDQVLNQHHVSETGLLTKAIICDEKDFGEKMDIDNASDELMSEKEKVVAESSSPCGFFLGRFGLDKDDVTVVKKLSTKSTRDSVKPARSETETLISVGNLTHGSYNNDNKLSSGLESSKLDGQFDVGTNPFETLTTFQETELNINKNLGFSNIDDEPMMQITSESSLLLSVGEQQPTNKSEEPKFEDFNIFRNNETKHNESETNLEFCSLVPSENEQTFEFQDDGQILYENTMEECKEESSERGLLNHFSDDIFENKMYSTPLDGIKFDEDRDLNSNELSLAFGNPRKIDEAFDVHTNLSMVNNSMVNLSGNVKVNSFHTSSGFGSQLQGQTHEEVVPSGMWRTGDGSQLQSGLVNTSHAQIPSSSSFHSFNIMSDKAGNGQFRLDERYSQGFGVNGLRSGRPEPVEFSFLTDRSQHNPLQGDSRVFSYNQQMEQQFDPSFWLRKNTMMPNPSGRNQMTAVCVWCRNEFNLQNVNSGTQDCVCPSCSAGFSGHVNYL